MSHGPEHRTKIAIQALLTAYKDAGLPLWWYMPIPAMGSAGVPDIVACVDGTLVGIEAKAEKKDGGRAPTKRQISLDPHGHAITDLNRGNMFALLVDQEIQY